MYYIKGYYPERTKREKEQRVHLEYTVEQMSAIIWPHKCAIQSTFKIRHQENSDMNRAQFFKKRLKWNRENG